jgi:hypothetical protein
MAYYDREDDGYKFMDLTEDEEFRQDLVDFFTGGRYEYSKEQLNEKGWDGLAEDFVEHMRWQATNETTGLFDITYVRNDKYDQRGKDAFGKLMEAYDRSDGGGYWVPCWGSGLCSRFCCLPHYSGYHCYWGLRCG